MANTVHGPFAKGGSTATGSYGTGVGQSNTYTSGNANNDETQSAVALLSFNPDLITSGFVLTGVTCAKDGTTASQLDVASGYAYLVQSDATLSRCDVATTTFSSSGHASSTLYLDLNPDGSWSWGTSHSAVTNHLTICSVATDGSSNISTVTDARNLNPALMSGMAGVFTHLLAQELSAKRALGGSTQTLLELWATDNHYWAFQQDTSGDTLLLDSTSGNTWTFGGNGTTQLPGAIAGVAGQSMVGSFGVPVIVAQTLRQHVTSTALTTVLSYTPTATGIYRVSGYVNMTASTASTLKAAIMWTDPDTNAVASGYFAATGSVGPILSLLSFSNPGANTWQLTLQTLTVAAKAANAITCQWQDSAGTPSDYVTYIIERLA